MDYNKYILRGYFSIFTLASIALLGFMIYVYIRQQADYLNTISSIMRPALGVIDTLSFPAQLIGFSLATIGIITPAIIYRGISKQKLWAKILFGLMIFLSLSILYLAWETIQSIEGVYYSASPYRKMFMSGAIPLLVASLSLLIIPLTKQLNKQPQIATEQKPLPQE